MAVRTQNHVSLSWLMIGKIEEFCPPDSGRAKVALIGAANLVLIPFTIVETALSLIAKMSAYCLKACSLIGKERYEKISSWSEESIHATICNAVILIARLNYTPAPARV
jgi:hypothetical protein